VDRVSQDLTVLRDDPSPEPQQMWHDLEGTRKYFETMLGMTPAEHGEAALKLREDPRFFS